MWLAVGSATVQEPAPACVEEEALNVGSASTPFPRRVRLCQGPCAEHARSASVCKAHHPHTMTTQRRPGREEVECDMQVSYLSDLNSSMLTEVRCDIARRSQTRWPR